MEGIKNKSIGSEYELHNYSINRSIQRVKTGYGLSEAGGQKKRKNGGGGV